MTDPIDEQYDKDQLHLAAQDGSLDHVKELLDAGADFDAFDEIGRTPLHYAAENEHFDVVALLLERGANVNGRHEAMIGNTPLGEIAGNCSLRMAEMLVSAGADPTIRGWMRLSALDRAEKREKEDGRQVYDLLCRVSRQRR